MFLPVGCGLIFLPVGGGADVLTCMQLVSYSYL